MFLSTSLSTLTCFQEALKLLLPEFPLFLLPRTTFSPPAFPHTHKTPQDAPPWQGGLRPPSLPLPRVAPAAQAGAVHLPPATRCTEHPFIYFSQFPSLGRSREATRSSALYKGTTAPATICSSTFPPSPSPPDAVQCLQDHGAPGHPHEPDVRSKPCLPLTFLRAHASKQPC